MNIEDVWDRLDPDTKKRRLQNSDCALVPAMVSAKITAQAKSRLASTGTDKCYSPLVTGNSYRIRPT